MPTVILIIVYLVFCAIVWVKAVFGLRRDPDSGRAAVVLAAVILGIGLYSLFALALNARAIAEILP